MNIKQDITMTRIIAIFVTIQCFICGLARAGNEVEQYRWNAGCVLDVAALRLESLAADKGATAIVVGRVEPGQTSDLVGPVVGTVTEGTITLIARLHGKTNHDRWSYQRIHLLVFSYRERPRIDFCLGGGGVAVLRLREGPRKRPPSAEVLASFFVPSEWVDHIAPASDFIAQNAAIFRSPPETGFDAKTKARLTGLLADDNPFLAIAAFRALAALDPTDFRPLFKSVRESNGVRRAVLLNVLLQSAKTDDLQEVLQGVSALVSSSDDTEQLRALALGTHLANSGYGVVSSDLILSNPHAAEVIERMPVADRLSPVLIRQIHWRQRQLGDAAERDAYLNAILDEEGMETSSK